MNWVDQFDGLKRLDPALFRSLIDKSGVVTIEKNSVVFGMGKAPEHLVLLLVGSIQVQLVSDSGRELVLYRVDAENSCVLTTACVLAYEESAATAIVETDLKAVLGLR